MKPEKWNTSKAAMYGATTTVLVLLARDYIAGEFMQGGVAFILGYLVGGMVIGALLFAGVAALRNLFVR